MQIPPGLLRKVRRIEIATNRLVDQGVAGSYHSVFKGRGVEFTEVRPYAVGDDVRLIDWNVTARSGSLFIKQYTEERDLTVFLMVDVSGSLRYGSAAIAKRELAAEIAALLAFAAVRNQDRIGLALTDERIRLLLRPARGRRQALRIVREILLLPGEGGTNLEKSLLAVVRTLRQRAVLFVVSDFVDSPLSSALKTAAAKHDVILLEVSDPLDLDPPLDRPVMLRDAETGRLAIFGRRAARRLARRRHEARRDLIELARRAGADHLRLQTDRPYLPELLAFFDRRAKRLNR